MKIVRIHYNLMLTSARPVIYSAHKCQNANNRAYPENTNFETFVPRNLKFHTFGDLHTTKKC